jgi:hypothetical protein
VPPIVEAVHVTVTPPPEAAAWGFPGADSVDTVALELPLPIEVK